LKILLVHNAEAGGDAAEAIPRIGEAISHAGHSVRAVSTRDPWRAALSDADDLVVAAGGDGTVRRIAAALLGSATPLTILPLGTANNIATGLGLADLTTEEAIARWPSAPRRTLDMLIARGPWGEMPLIEGVGLGLFASTMAALDARHNIALAHEDDPQEKVATVIDMLRTRLRDAAAVTVRATLDGEDLSGEYLLLEALNMPFVGPNLHLAPEADPADGRLDVVCVPVDQRAALDRYLKRRLSAGRLPADLPVRRGRHLVLEWTGFDIHADDTAWPGTGRPIPDEPSVIDIRVDPGAVQFLG
jgi:diacylglycerol kinase (ATP)